LLAGGLSVRPAGAQQPDSGTAAPSPEDLARTEAQLMQRENALTPVPPAFALPGIVPSITSNVPSAFGFNGDTGGIGVGYADKQINTINSSGRGDGAASLVLGIGDLGGGINLDAGYNDLSLRHPFDTSASPGNPGSSGSFTFKLHKSLTQDLSVAFGAENVLNWGHSNDTPSSEYVIATQRLRLQESRSKPFSRLYVTVGGGNGRFRQLTFIDAGQVPVFSGSRIRPIASAAINILPSVNAFVEYNGSETNIGASFVPIARLPFVITPALDDISHSTANYTRFTIAAGYAFSY
jgi:hypothetical protein